jgi:hypothetical protein
MRARLIKANISKAQLSPDTQKPTRAALYELRRALKTSLADIETVLGIKSASERQRADAMRRIERLWQQNDLDSQLT